MLKLVQDLRNIKNNKDELSMNELSITTEIASVYSFAFQQNQYPLITSLELCFHSDPLKDNGIVHQSKSDIKVVLTSDPEAFPPEEWYIDNIEANRTILLQKRALKMSNEYLSSLTEQIETNLCFTVYEGDKIVKTEYHQTVLLPKNHWAGENRMPELLAAFSTPNSLYVAEIVRNSSELLKNSGHGSALDGYQSNTRERPYLMAAAIWNVISNESIAYLSQPASFATSGQRIRLPEDIKQTKAGACLDLSLLFSACLEHIGLNSIITLTKRHACCGVLLIKECFPLLTN